MNEEIQHEPEQTGIVLELARDDVARKKFLKMAGKTMGSAAAATGLAAFIAACGSSNKKTTSTPASSTGNTGNTGASTSKPTGDLAIVEYALALEYLESEFYAKVATSGLFSGSMLATIKTFGEEEDQHVAALKAAVSQLGGTPTVTKGKFPITSASSVASLAYTVENLGAAAYLGQAANIKSPAILAAGLSIHSVEARHAATLGYATKQSVTPTGAFGKGMSMAQVLKVVKPFIVS